MYCSFYLWYTSNWIFTYNVYVSKTFYIKSSLDVRNGGNREPVLNLDTGISFALRWLLCASLKYGLSKFIRMLWKPFPIGCIGIKQLKNHIVGLLGYWVTVLEITSSKWTISGQYCIFLVNFTSFWTLCLDNTEYYKTAGEQSYKGSALH